MIKGKRLSPMPRTKGSKNRPKTNITKDYASQIAEKQTALKKAEKEVASLEAKKAKADAKAAEEAKKAEAEAVLKRLLAKWHERGRDSGKAEINKKTNNKNKCRVDKLNSRSSHGNF